MKQNNKTSRFFGGGRFCFWLLGSIDLKYLLLPEPGQSGQIRILTIPVKPPSPLKETTASPLAPARIAAITWPSKVSQVGSS